MNLDSIRAENVAWLAEHGFVVAPHLPLRRHEAPALRPVGEIVARLLALDVVFLWVSAPEADFSTAALRAAARHHELEHAMTADERRVFRQGRKAAHRAHVGSIGWRLENMWPLAWVLGFEPEPPLDGEMIDDPVIRAMILEFLPQPGEGSELAIARLEVRALEDVVRLEDRFYCCHNAVRSAQLGGDTVPEAFDPRRDPRAPSRPHLGALAGHELGRRRPEYLTTCGPRSRRRLATAVLVRPGAPVGSTRVRRRS